jgi:hypothetical protein
MGAMRVIAVCQIDLICAATKDWQRSTGHP